MHHPDYDILIIGGGPGGMAALLWSHSLGMRGLLLERGAEPGGQMLAMHHRIIDYPGLVLRNGHELRNHFVNHLRELALDWRLNCDVKRVDFEGMRIAINGEGDDTGNGETLNCRALIIATGARKRRLGVPGEEKFVGRGVSFSATGDHPLFAGREVVVIGGGDSAIENCLILARVCPRVTLIHRSDKFRARDEWTRQVIENPRISVIVNAELKQIGGEGEVTHVIIEDSGTGEQRTIPTGGVFIRIGMAPNTEFLKGQLDLDDEGYIRCDARLQTSRPMIYAVGDVTRPVCKSVATAVGHGALAAKAIAETLRQI
jgi:thioredoxin reductase (NADPH)